MKNSLLMWDCPRLGLCWADPHSSGGIRDPQIPEFDSSKRDEAAHIPAGLFSCAAPMIDRLPGQQLSPAGPTSISRLASDVSAADDVSRRPSRGRRCDAVTRARYICVGAHAPPPVTVDAPQISAINTNSYFISFWGFFLLLLRKNSFFYSRDFSPRHRFSPPLHE